MTKEEIVRSIKAQIIEAEQNRIVLKDCVFVIGDNVYKTLFDLDVSIYARVMDFTISDVPCWVTSIHPDMCKLFIPMEDYNATDKRNTN